VVFENIGESNLFAKAFAALARDGRLVTAGGHGGGLVALDVNRLYHNNLTIIGATGETPRDVKLSLEAAARGQFQVLIDCILPLAEAVRAHELVAARLGIGKSIRADKVMRWRPHRLAERAPPAGGDMFIGVVPLALP
jgi:NADPH:quinone reductase-like Zn-dependent oxidoreductase